MLHSIPSLLLCQVDNLPSAGRWRTTNQSAKFRTGSCASSKTSFCSMLDGSWSFAKIFCQTIWESAPFSSVFFCWVFQVVQLFDQSYLHLRCFPYTSVNVEQNTTPWFVRSTKHHHFQALSKRISFRLFRITIFPSMTILTKRALALSTCRIKMEVSINFLRSNDSIIFDYKWNINGCFIYLGKSSMNLRGPSWMPRKITWQKLIGQPSI